MISYQQLNALAHGYRAMFISAEYAIRHADLNKKACHEAEMCAVINRARENLAVRYAMRALRKECSQ